MALSSPTRRAAAFLPGMAESPDGKAKGRLVHRTPTFLLAASLLAVATAASAQTLPEKGEPPISAQTEISGGERPPEQQAMRFDVADLAIEENGRASCGAKECKYV